MAKKDSIAESDFDPAPSPRGPEEPLSGASRCAPDTPALPATDGVVDRWFNDCIRGSAIAASRPQRILRAPAPQFTAASAFEERRIVVRCRRFGPVRTVPMPTSQLVSSVAK